METIRYSPIGKEDCSFGTGSFEVTLADGRVVMLSQIDIGAIINAGMSTTTLTGLTLVNATLTGTSSITGLTLVNATLTTPTINTGVLNTSTVGADPTAALGIASKQYVDALTNLVSHTTAATIAQSTRTALLSGASFTLLLNTAVGHTGQMITFVHAGTSLTQVYTIDGAGSETLDSTTTYLLYTAGERLTIVSDGANWVVVDHQAKTEWVDAGAMTITGTTTDPTKPTTPDLDKVYWRRDGNQVLLRYILQLSSAAGSAAGSGNYLFALPTNITFDTTILTPVGTTMATAIRSEASASYLSGNGYAAADSTSAALASFFAYDTSRFQVQIMEITDGNLASPGALGNTNHAVTNSESSYNFMLQARAANWRL